jgi:hypothetical protein
MNHVILDIVKQLETIQKVVGDNPCFAVVQSQLLQTLQNLIVIKLNK